MNGQIKAIVTVVAMDVDDDDENLPLRFFNLLGHIGKLLDGCGGAGGAIQISLALLDGHFLHLFHFLVARLLNGLLLEIGHFRPGLFFLFSLALQE